MSNSFRQGFYKIMTCRRSLIGLTGILACSIMGLHLHIDTSGAIAMIVTAIAGANAAENTFTKRKSDEQV